MERITSRRNEKIIHMKKLGADSAYRRACGEFLCDGRKLFSEAVMHGLEITAALIGEKNRSEIPENIPVFSVPDELLDHVSPLKTAQDIVFSCRIPQKTDTDIRGTIVVLDGLQNPGNLGTVIRTANAFRIDTVLLTGQCADLYNPKTVRASMGAVFRQNVVEINTDGLISLKQRGMKLYGAALTETACDIREVSFENAAFVIGSEGSGISEAVLDLCDKYVIIPMAPECESLNAAAAAAVIMWEMSGKK